MNSPERLEVLSIAGLSVIDWDEVRSVCGCFVDAEMTLGYTHRWEQTGLTNTNLQADNDSVGTYSVWVRLDHRKWDIWVNTPGN